MVTQRQLHEHLGRRPFRPFRVTLTSGETIDVTRTAQGICTPRQFIVGTPDDEHFRWVPLGQIAQVDAGEPATPPQA